MEFDCVFAGATPARMVEIFTDPTFLDEFAAEVGVEQHRAEVTQATDTATIQYHWTFPTHAAPAIFRKFLPDNIALDWKTAWKSGTTSPSGTFEGEFADLKVVFHGAMTLGKATTLGKETTLGKVTSAGASVAWHCEGEVTAKRFGLVPGSVVASALNDLFLAVLKDQQKVANRWLGDVCSQ